MMRLCAVGSAVVATFLIASAIFLIVAPHFGWCVSIILSGSMEPALPVGGIEIVRPVDPKQIGVGDIIVYNAGSGSAVTSHRVVEIRGGPGLSFITRGDASAQPDPTPIPEHQVIGVDFLAIPYLGYIFQFLKTPLGLLTAIVVPGLLMVVSGLDFDGGFWRSRTNQK